MADESKAAADGSKVVVDHTKLFTIKGSCHCGNVRYTIQSKTPYPYMICHCMVDTKTAGCYTANIMGEADTLEVEGREHVKVYAADMFKISGKEEDRGKKSHHERHFCKDCASYLWASHSSWPKWVWPFASSVDTPLPTPPKECHIWTTSKLAHIRVPAESDTCKHFPGYPDLSIEDFHKQNGIFCGGDDAPTADDASAH